MPVFTVASTTKKRETVPVVIQSNVCVSGVAFRNYPEFNLNSNTKVTREE